MSMPLTGAITLGQQGRLVIPTAFRQQLGLKPGDSLSLRVEDGRLVVESQAQLLARVQSRYRRPAGAASMVDELIAERRAEYQRDEAAAPAKARKVGPRR